MELTEARVSVVEDLQNVGLTVKDHVPAKVVPPLVIIGTGDPYLEESETFRGYNQNGSDFVVRLELFVITGTATNSAATKTLDEMIQKVIFNLGEWKIDGVSAPYMATANDAVYLTSRISISNTITIGGN